MIAHQDESAVGASQSQRVDRRDDAPIADALHACLSEWTKGSRNQHRPSFDTDCAVFAYCIVPASTRLLHRVPKFLIMYPKCKQRLFLATALRLRAPGRARPARAPCTAWVAWARPWRRSLMSVKKCVWQHPKIVQHQQPTLFGLSLLDTIHSIK